MPDDNDPVCGLEGPPVQPGMWAYRCSLPPDHQSDVCEAWLDGRMLDSWPRPRDFSAA